jgi:NADH:ubiquinone oxidoreductase subunit E
MTKNTINSLLDLQKRHGYLPQEEMIALIKKEQISGVDIYGVATFYSQFRLAKPGRHKVCVCAGTACHVKNSLALLLYLEEILRTKKGKTTSDGRITIETVNCIGACAKAPAMVVDGVVYGDLTKAKIKKIIDSLQ